MTKKNLERYAFFATCLIVGLTVWIATVQYMERRHAEDVAIIQLAQTVEPAPVVEAVPVEPVAVEPTFEEVELELPKKITAAVFNRKPSDVPTLEELDVIGFNYGIPGKILMGMAKKETHLNSNRVSHRGARGMFQLMPGTASFLGVENIMDNYESADAAARYLDHIHQLLFDKPIVEHTEYSLRMTLGGYNAGPYTLTKIGDGYALPPYQETRNYVNDIMGYFHGEKYYVEKGDTIKYIANKYNISPVTLMTINDVDHERLRYGVFIDIVEPISAEGTYVIAKGDTLFSIARKFDTTVAHLAAVNQIEDVNQISAGASILI